MSGNVSPEDQYISHNRRRLLYVGAILILTMALAIYSFGVGSSVISFDIAMDMISNRLHGIIPDRREDYWTWLNDRLVIDGTIPVAIGGMLIGAILGISGAVMQICVRNPLASPYTTGISSAALFGVTIFLALNITILPNTGEMSLIVNAFVFSMVPCILMVIMTIRKRVTPTLLVLIGIGIMYLFNSFTMVLKYRADEEVLSEIQMWSVGSISEIGWTAVWYLAGAFIFLIITMYIFASRLDVMAAGENMAHSMGINPSRIRLICMVIISACTSVAVCFAGTIGFVGLVIPHVSRIIVGPKCKMLLPCSAVVGALLLLGSDVLARYLNLGLPVGAVTAAIGAPIFLYFLVRMRTNGWGR